METEVMRALYFGLSLFIFNQTQASNLSQFFGSSTAVQKKCQQFTASGTWTKPTNVTHVEVLAVGGGGGGAGTSQAGGSGGSGFLQVC